MRRSSVASAPGARRTGAAHGRFDADVEARCRDLFRTLAVHAPDAPDGSADEPVLGTADPELWASWSKGGPCLEAPPDPTGGALFLSHAWDEPKLWSKYFVAQPFVVAKQLQVSTGLSAAVNRGLARPRVWVDCASLYDRVRGGNPPVECDHPLAQVSFGPYQMPVPALKDLFSTRADGCQNGYTVLRLLQGHSFECVMGIRSFDEKGRPNKQVDPRPVAWEIPPGCYYVRSARVMAEDKISPEEAASKEEFQSRKEHLRSWWARLGLRDQVWVEFTLGSIRSECLTLAEPMLALQGGLVAVAAWNYFDRLWPLCEWALFCAHRGPDHVQLAADACMGPALVEYHRALRRLSVTSAECREPLDRDLLLGLLERVFACTERMVTVGFQRPGHAVLTEPVQQREVDFSPVERYVRVTAIAAFARESALAVSEALQEDDAGWADLAAELGFEELHGALRLCRPKDWAKQAAQATDGTAPDGTESSYAAAVEYWWTWQVMPILGRERRRALR